VECNRVGGGAVRSRQRFRRRVSGISGHIETSGALDATGQFKVVIQITIMACCLQCRAGA